MKSNYLIISSAVELVRVAQENIVYISSDGNYSTLILVDGESRILTDQLGQIEKMINDQLDDKVKKNFIRIGKQVIINRNYIYYIHLTRQQLVLSDNKTVKHTIKVSREALKRLKELVEKERS